MRRPSSRPCRSTWSFACSLTTSVAPVSLDADDAVDVDGLACRSRKREREASHAAVTPPGAALDHVEHVGRPGEEGGLLADGHDVVALFGGRREAHLGHRRRMHENAGRLLAKNLEVGLVRRQEAVAVEVRDADARLDEAACERHGARRRRLAI